MSSSVPPGLVHEDRGQPADACAMVIFGAGGDLTKRKLFPALYNLAQSKLLPQQFAIIGASREEYSTEQFRQKTTEEMKEFLTGSAGDAWEWFANRLYYMSGDFKDPALYKKIQDQLAQVDRDHATCGNRLFYLATSPSFFPIVVKQLGAAGLTNIDSAGWKRVVIEKPFGHDLASAVALNRDIGEVLHESQIYRIDHYLGKETVQNLLVFRFANGIFEPLWSRQYIDHVQITVAENIGVEGRGPYYEESGALRDIIQNHVMQLVAIVGMEAPSNFRAETVRDEKVKLLRAVRPIHPDDALSHTVRGQYGAGWIDGERVAAYREEPGVNPQSLRETFVAMKVDIDNWRWAGTPFYLRTGKRLPKRATEIAIQFRRVPHSPFGGNEATPAGLLPTDSIDPNLLVLRIQPDEGITLRFSAKVPGQSMRIRTVNMDFLYGSAFLKESPEAYERLLLDCMLGDPTLFAREDEVEEAWRFCTAILDGWRAHPPDPVDCPNYEAGSWGPHSSREFMARDGRQWRRL
jgi:glucose-6-phosphate 1-dehydrogenase